MDGTENGRAAGQVGKKPNPKVLATRRFERQMERFAKKLGPLDDLGAWDDDEALAEALWDRLRSKGLA